MAQFRTTAEIKRAVLEKSGESTNGNSAYDTLALTYINDAYQAIIGGGSIYSRQVDEAWTWARSRHPIILELEPAYVNGSVLAVRDSAGITLTLPPDVSVQGWQIQIGNDPTVYKLTQHTGASSDATLDSGFMGVSGAYSFRIFKLDYEVSPKYLVIDHTNDKIDFIESGTTQLTGTLTHGAYLPDELAAHATIVMNAVIGTNATYTVTYDEVSKHFTFTSNLSGGAVFKLLGATGTNLRRSSLPSFGFDCLDFTSAGSYSSSYIIGGISRLIEPFRIFKKGKNPLVESTDPITMELEYPVTSAREQTPSLFAKMFEDASGAIVVRFNSYPKERMKVEVNWIPVPHDLQDNAASVPVIPKKDISVLIHAGAALVMFDKEDTKFKDIFDLTSAQLMAMEKKNRSEMRRTDTQFGAIQPRADLIKQSKDLQYGYEYSTGGSQLLGGTTFPVMAKVSLTYQNFTNAALSQTIVARQLASNKSLFAILIKHTAAWAGGTISALTFDIGIAGDTTKFVQGFDAFQAVSNTAQESVLVFYYPAASTDIVVTANAVGGNLSTLTAGVVDIYFQELGTP